MGERGNTSKSYLTGIIALMFLFIGYQTALFVHRAAVTMITASRDNPDTVYVLSQIPQGEIERSDTKDSGNRRVTESRGRTGMANNSEVRSTTVRKNAAHHPVAEAIRRNAPVKKVESFRFDPNTVSVEELCRLGFSVRQAQSIQNYRSKGGRFRRKSDFAKSYVVSDSIYKRLEPYIDIPLIDLNLADSALFESLPGIGGWYASAIVRHRDALGGFSDKRQLMDIRGIDSRRYAALEELVTLSPEYIKSYPLWSLPADSLKKHPYIRTAALARAIVLYRENNPLDRLTVRGLLEAGVIDDDCAGKLSLCRFR